MQALTHRCLCSSAVSPVAIRDTCHSRQLECQCETPCVHAMPLVQIGHPAPLQPEHKSLFCYFTFEQYIGQSAAKRTIGEPAPSSTAVPPMSAQPAFADMCPQASVRTMRMDQRCACTMYGRESSRLRRGSFGYPATSKPTPWTMPVDHAADFAKSWADVATSVAGRCWAWQLGSDVTRS